MNLPRIIPTFPEYDITITYTITKRIKAPGIADAERTARIMLSTLKDAKLHSIIKVEQEKRNGRG